MYIGCEESTESSSTGTDHELSMLGSPTESSGRACKLDAGWNLSICGSVVWSCLYNYYSSGNCSDH